jgi:hypothetical protein
MHVQTAIGMRLRFYAAIALIAFSLALSFLLVLFSEQIASVTRIPAQAVTYLAGALVFGFYEGVGMIREMLKERDQRKLTHSEKLEECLKEWLLIPLEPDTPLQEPQSMWLEEVKEHLKSAKRQYLFYTRTDEPIYLTSWQLWFDYVFTCAKAQYESATEIKNLVATEIEAIFTHVNDSFTNTEEVNSRLERCYRRQSLVEYVYHRLDLSEGIILDIKGLSQRYMLYGDAEAHEETYAWSPNRRELETSKASIQLLCTDSQLLKLISDKHHVYALAKYWYTYFRGILTEMQKDIESFKPLDGRCERCP